MKCPNCQTENPEGALFCGKCGQSLQRELVCPQCEHTNPQGNEFCNQCGYRLIEAAPQPPIPPSPEPTSFVSDRYQVKEFLGEGGKKKVYLAHDTVLDRDVAFALLKTETMDDETRTRIKREAQAMGRLGDHPNIITIYEFGEHEGQPYLILLLMPGGDVEDLIKKAPEHRLPVEQAVDIAKSICLGLAYAHSKGIIHRDLKPGNVYLTADGTAKIGDFGLAVAVDVSRLTQSGMMVGTPYYLPPEQAMGGEVTPKADLYSLGAMLYEMVAGRPPFVGDDPYGIIGQHINTPPVSPTWHRADLPPALEALILQLLAKDPQQRPASAANVHQALESIEAGKIEKVPSQEAPTLAESPLYRRVFVGRETELHQLQSAFDGAMSGQGALMMVVGEPGIGKTALCEQLSTYATLRGGKPLVGHCYEEGSLSLPYLAFVEAMRSYVLTRETRDLRKELGTGAADVARIVSEVRQRLKVQPRPPESPEEDRYRLMQAMTSFLSNAATVQPLLVVVEDLHDADKDTLEMLTHVSRNISRERLLIIGTYRDVEVDRTHPLSAALAELRRVSTYGRVLLRGLNADEVRRMLESITGQDIPWGLAEAVHRQTEGNPLFVQEVIRYLVEEGLIRREEGRWQVTRETPVEMSIPEGLRDVIGKRLSSLSQECNRVLSVAAVIGREFSLDTLCQVVSIDEDRFIDALKEAVGLAILEEQSQVGTIRYRFTHAFFRQTLYEEIIAPQRLQLHQQVARVLEMQYANRLEEHAAELAEHFAQSTDRADLAKAVSYGEMAAQRALAVYAYGENVRLLEQALKVQEVLDLEDKGKRCDLLLALGNALLLAGEPRHASDVEAPEALSIAKAIGDNKRASDACLLALEALGFQGAFQAYASPEYTQWTEWAEHYAEPDTVGRVRADVGLGCVRYATGNLVEAQLLFHRALEVARRLNNPEEFWWAAQAYILYVQAPQHARERLRLVEELTETTRTGVSTRTLVAALPSMAHVFFEAGRRDSTEEIVREVRDLAESTGQAHLLLVSMALDVVLAALDGHLDEAVEIGQRINTRSKELDLSEFTGPLVGFTSLRPLIHLGKAGDALQRTETNDLTTIPARPLCLASVGRDTEATEMLELLALARPDINSARDETPAWVDILLLETAVLVGHRQAAELLLRKFIDNPVPTTGMFFATCTARHLGAAAALLGKPDEARAHYREALRVANEMRFRPEIALTRLQLAELLLEHYPDKKSEALEHLDFAINEFREMKMQPSLERTLKHKEILGA